MMDDWIWYPNDPIIPTILWRMRFAAWLTTCRLPEPLAVWIARHWPERWLPQK